MKFEEILPGHERQGDSDYYSEYEESDENIELALNSVARGFKDKENVKMTYVKEYSPKDFRELAKTQFKLD